jgi:hypothetical protein
MSVPRAVLVDVPVGPDDVSDSAIRLEERVAALRRLAPRLGLELEVVRVDDVHDARRFEGARAAWWLGRVTRNDEAERLWEALSRHGVPCFDPPDAVDEAHCLARAFPLLERAGLPQAWTRFYPLSPAEVALDEAALARLLARRLRWLWVRGKGVFFRTFYGTRKLRGVLHVARDKAELVEGATTLVLALREQDVGGLAVRELLDIAGEWVGGDAWLSREYRVFVLRGEPVMWLCHVDHGDLRRRMDPAALARAGPPPEQRAAMLDHARRAGAALRASLVSVDFALLRDGRLVCVETNPGHCSGWGSPPAFVRVHGELLRRLCGLPPLDAAGSLALARDAGLDLWGQGDVWDFV